MKILIASDVSKYYMSGVAGAARLLSENLKKLGHDVRVLTLSNKNRSFKEAGEYYIASFHVPLYPELRYTFIRRHKYLNELISWKPDIIHTQTEGAVSGLTRYISKKTGAHILMTMHSDYPRFFFGTHYDSWYSHLFIKPFLMWAYRGVDIMTTPSEKAKRMLIEYRPNKDVRVIGNGIKLEEFTKSPTEAERLELLASLGFQKNDILLITVSRLSHEKRIDELIRFLPKLKEHNPAVKLLIVGFGPDRGRLESLAKREKTEDSVKFSGRIGHSELYRYYKSANIFVCASDYETQGLTYLEAMACGLPSVCRDDAALYGIITDGVNGFLYNTEDEFIKKVLRLIDDKDTYKKTAENALARSRDFCDLNAAARLTELYKELLKA